MNPFQEISEDPDRVIVFVQVGTRTHGWEVFNATASYQITGYPRGSAHARVTVEGEFHRMSKSESSMQIEDRMNQAAARRLAGPQKELEQ